MSVPTKSGSKAGLFVIAGVAAIGIYLFLHFKRQLNLLYSFCYKVKGVRLNKITARDAKMDIIIGFENKSDLDFMIQSYDFGVYVNGKFIGTVSQKNMNQYVQPRGWSDLLIGIQFNPVEVIKNAVTLDNILNVVINKEQVRIGLQGYFSVSTSAGISVKDFPFSMEMTLAELMKPADASTPSNCP